MLKRKMLDKLIAWKQKAGGREALLIKGGPAPVRHYDLDEGLLDAVLKGEINPGRVFTAEYDLDHIQDAYEAMDQRKVIKALIRF